jgi:hypothetical protein
MLVQRWAILQTAMRQGISIVKTFTMVNALVKLHNFCIDENNAEMLELSPTNNFRIMSNDLGYAPPKESANYNVAIPTQILDGVNHFDNINRTKRRQRN